MELIAIFLSAGLAALLLPRWSQDMVATGLLRENFRGARLAFPLGALLVSVSLIALVPLAVLDDRADLDLLEPGLGRWFGFVIGVAFLGLLDDMLGRGHEGDTPPGLARARPRGRLRPPLDRARSRPSAPSASPPSPSRDSGASGPATSPTSPCCCSRPTSSTCSTCARAGSRRRS